jgi:hypothetical protein
MSLASRRRLAAAVAVCAAIVGFFFAAPVLPWKQAVLVYGCNPSWPSCDIGMRLEVTGFQSMSCALFHYGGYIASGAYHFRYGSWQTYEVTESGYYVGSATGCFYPSSNST